MAELLPIDTIQQELQLAWASRRNFVLRAPTGSGKSTRIPPLLYNWQGFDRERHIIVLQPRRMAARLLAGRVAEELGGSTGQLVGYRIRFDSRTSSATRIFYVTEGLLLRQLVCGESMDRIGAILFDEFHERHLEGDVCLGLARGMQEKGWMGKIGVMSATLETGGLVDYLPDCAVLESDGRQYPVDIRYLGSGGKMPLWEFSASAVKSAIADGCRADFLLFMPGKHEINKSAEAISSLRETRGWDIVPLHGELDPQAQDSAIRAGSRPRIIIATNIAETSLTLPGIRTVIDAGLAKMAAFDPRRGINTLLTTKISRASADQRSGRAGRLEAGHCYRMWTPKDHEHRPAYTEPEIHRLDLSETLLNLVSNGIGEDFPWYERPADGNLGHAQELLEDLGAISGNHITAVGSKMANYPLHPRHSRMLEAAKTYGCEDLILAAIAISQTRRFILPLGDSKRAQERERWWEAAENVSDLLKEVIVWQIVLRENANMAFCRDWGLHFQSIRQATQIYQQLKRLSQTAGSDVPVDPNGFAKSLLTGYADQIGLRTGKGTANCRLVHGRGGVLQRDTVVGDARLFVATDIEERELKGEVALILGRITAIGEDWLEEQFPGELKRRTCEKLDVQRRRVVCVEEVVFRDLVLQQKEHGEPDPDKSASLLAEGIAGNRWILKNWNEAAENWIRRVNTLAHFFPEWEIKPVFEDDRLILIEQICAGAVSYKQVKDRPVLPVLETWLPESILPVLDQYVPVRYDLPGKGSPKLRYEADGSVILPARIQQLYDIRGADLSICDGRCRLRIEILAPNNRPVQITDDLDGFWERQYPEIRKQLFGRYPKHEWR